MAESSNARSMAKISPDSLQDLCIFYCMNNLDVLVSTLNTMTIADDAASSFSMLLGNRMLQYYTSCILPTNDGQTYLDQFLQNNQLCNEVKLLRDGLLTADNVIELANNPLKSVEVSCTDSDDSSGALCSQNLYLLLQNNLERLKHVSLHIKGLGSKAIYLLKLLVGERVEENCSNSGDELASSVDVYWQDAPANSTRFNVFDMNVSEGTSAYSEHSNKTSCNYKATNLKSFSLDGIVSEADLLLVCDAVHELLKCNKGLQQLTLISDVPKSLAVFHNSFLNGDVHQNLQSLTLSANCDQSERVQEWKKTDLFTLLTTMKHLRHLDVSSGSLQRNAAYSEDEVEQFTRAIKAMPCLRSLDIAGTNLHTFIAHKHGLKQCSDHCMPGFEGRRFEYLGLLHAGDACKHKFIPALKVSGSSDIEQLLVALWSYQHNPVLMDNVLISLELQLLHHPQLHLPSALAIFDGILSFLERNWYWEVTSDRASTNLFMCLNCLYIVSKLEQVKASIGIQQRRRLLERLLVISHTHIQCDRSSPQNTHHNKIYRAVMALIVKLELDHIIVYSYRYEQYIEVLLGMFNDRRTHSVQKTLSLRLLHSAVRYSQHYKAVAGTKLKLVDKLMLYIMNYVTNSRYTETETFEKVWSIMWTLTDEVPSNSAQFVNNAGCDIAKICLLNFDNHSLHRKITGAMNNIAENFELHEHLMREDLVLLFKTFLADTEYDFDVIAHAAGFLVMLVARPSAWSLVNVDREQVIIALEDCIKCWDLTVSKGVKFRSLSPMLQMIENKDCGVAQLWGAWEICNLVQVKPDAYCSMFEEENGPAIVARVLQETDVREDVRELLNTITHHCTMWINTAPQEDELVLP